jgi:hypothetical protein
MLSLFRKPTEPPKAVDRVAIFRSAVDQAIRDATIGRDNDWALKSEMALALDQFAAAIRLERATRRPL